MVIYGRSELQDLTRLYREKIEYEYYGETESEAT